MEDLSDEEKECHLPPAPVKPQKTLFSYFGKNTPVPKPKSSDSAVKKSSEPCKQKKIKVKSNENSRNSGISLSIFGQSAAKKICKKSPKVNALDKFLTEIDSDENIEDVVNNADEYDDLNNVDTSLAASDIDNTKGDNAEDENNIKENGVTDNSQTECNEQESMECDSHETDKNDVPLIDHQVKEKDNIEMSEHPLVEKDINEFIEEETTVKVNKRGQFQKIKYTAVQLNCTGSETSGNCSDIKSQSTPVKGRKKKKVKGNVSFNEELTEGASSQSEKESISPPCSIKKKSRTKVRSKSKSPSKSPSPRKKLLGKKCMENRSDINRSYMSENCLEADVNESPNKTMKRLLRKQQFESSDEEVDVVTVEKQNTNKGDVDEQIPQLIAASIHEEEFQKPISYSNCELMEGITPLDNSSPMKKTNTISRNGIELKSIEITESEQYDKKQKLIGSIYPSTTESKYKNLLSLTNNTTVKLQNNDIVQKPVEIYIKMLQAEYPGVAIKKMFLQLLECQKNTITKNLTKVESSKKVLETLWERDSQLKSEEIALAEELKRKEEEMALADLKKKMKNDIRTSFGRTKKMKKKIVEPLDDENLEVVTNKELNSAKKGKNCSKQALSTGANIDEAEPKSAKKKSKRKKSDAEEFLIVEEDSQKKETTNDIRSSFKLSKGSKTNKTLITVETDDSSKTPELKKTRKKSKGKEIMDSMIANTLDDEDELNDKNTSASCKKSKMKSTGTPSSKGESETINIKSKTEASNSDKKPKRKSIKDMFGNVKEGSNTPKDKPVDNSSNVEEAENNKSIVEIIDHNESETKKSCRKSKSIKELMKTEKSDSAQDNGLIMKTGETKTNIVAADEDSTSVTKDTDKPKSAKKGKRGRPSKADTDLILIPSNKEEVLKEEIEEYKQVKTKSSRTPSPLEEVLDNSQNIDKTEVERSRRRRSSRSSKKVVNYLDTSLSGENGEQIKLDSLLVETLVENIDVEVEIKTEDNHADEATDENIKPRKRKLSRSGSASKKKIKLSSEKPVTRRWSSKKSIDYKSEAADDTESKIEENQVEMETSKFGESSNNQEKENNKNVDEAPILRRSRRVRKPVVAYISNDHDAYEEEICGIKDLKEETVEEKSNEKIGEKDEANESNDSIILTSSQEKSENVLVLKSTLSRAIETLDLLEQSPRRSPKKSLIDIKLDENYVNAYLSWTEKYQPAKARNVIGDKSNVRKIFDWLLLWKERHESAVRKIARYEGKSKRKSDYTDSDSESEESEIEDYLPNTIILTGPSGCGTTAAVYACAKQLDFKVLELNPSMYRTGKQIFDQVSEAVVSHQVNKLSDASEENSQDGTVKKDFFMPKKEKVVAKKETPLKTRTDTNVASTGVKAMSLVLFEQVDIVYDEIDRGFYQGITDLRYLAKRPIILTANDSAVRERVFGDDAWVDHIPLSYPSVEKALPMLQLMCLVEYVFIPKQILTELIKSCKNDIRRTILHLMFWFNQGKKPLFKTWDIKTNKDQNNRNDITKDMKEVETNLSNARNSLFNSEDTNTLAMEITSNILPVHVEELFINREQILEGRKCNCSSLHTNHSFVKKSLTNSYSSIDHIAESADGISEMNSFLNIDKNTYEGDRFNWSSTLTDSLSDTFSKEKEDLTIYPITSVCKDVKNVYSENYENSFSDKINYNERPNISYSDMHSSLLEAHTAKYYINRKPFNSDVIPYLNKICQIEDLKLSSIHHRKRGNRRYMHYLQSVGIHLEEGALQELSKPLS